MATRSPTTCGPRRPRSGRSVPIPSSPPRCAPRSNGRASRSWRLLTVTDRATRAGDPRRPPAALARVSGRERRRADHRRRRARAPGPRAARRRRVRPRAARGAGPPRPARPPRRVAAHERAGRPRRGPARRGHGRGAGAAAPRAPTPSCARCWASEDRACGVRRDPRGAAGRDEHRSGCRRSPPPRRPLAARLRDVASSPVREILALTQQPGVISFAGGLPAPELFDAPGLRAAFAAALDDEAYGRTLQYSTTEGDPALRAAIAAAHDRARPGRPRPTTILVTSGSQQALTLIAAVLLEPGDAVLVEEPSYLAALQCFQMAGARVVPVPCDDDGLDPEALAALVRRERPKLLYTVPTFHNPTGRTLPLERRAALAQAAARLGLWIVEDDPYGELRYRGEPIAPVAVAGRRAGPDDRAVDVVEGAGPRPADRLAAHARGAAPRAGRRQAGRRPAHVDDRPGRGRPLAAALRPRRARRRPARRLRPAPRRARRRPARDAARGLALDAARRRHVRLGDAARRLGRRRAAAATRWPARSRSSPAGRSSPARRTAATLRLSFTTHTVPEIAEGLGRLRAAVDSRR